MRRGALRLEYARALISGGGKDVKLADGNTYKLDDSDTPMDYSAIVNGAKAAGLDGQHTSGWAAIDDALANGQPIVADGNITSAWKAEFPTGDPTDHYGSTKYAVTGHFIAIMGKYMDTSVSPPVAKYIVSDPMFTGGAVAMTKEQLSVFLGEKPDVTIIGDPKK